MADAKTNAQAIVGGIVILPIVFFAFVHSMKDERARKAMPQRQTAFVSTVTDSVEHWDNANDAKREAKDWGAIRGEKIEEALGGQRHAVNWIGEVADIEAQGSSIFDSVEPGAFLVVRPHDGGYDMSLQSDYGTIIPRDSRLYDVVKELSVGDRVYFSGAFLPANDRQGVYEDSMTTAGRMSSPEYEFQFVEIGSEPAPEGRARERAKAAAGRVAKNTGS